MSFVRILSYQMPKTTTPVITAACSSDLLSVHEQIEGLRSAAAGFLGEEKTLSADQLTISYVSTWNSKAEYDAFYAANQALIQQWDAYKVQYGALYDVGITDAASGD